MSTKPAAGQATLVFDVQVPGAHRCTRPPGQASGIDCIAFGRARWSVLLLQAPLNVLRFQLSVLKQASKGLQGAFSSGMPQCSTQSETLCLGTSFP